MSMAFHKYEGAGNDFIVIDGRAGGLSLSESDVAGLCHRRFGIGADGLMVLVASEIADYEVVYYNADGRVGSFCGNGGRCIAHYACQVLQIVGERHCFMAADGRHEALINQDGTVTLTMNPVGEIHRDPDGVFMDTGSPHVVVFVDDLDHFPVEKEGRAIRNQARYRPGGTNVNFVERSASGLKIRTYERGVENETLACGTGITASAIAATGTETGVFSIRVFSRAGHAFLVEFDKSAPNAASDISLRGPVSLVFRGECDKQVFQESFN